MAVAAAGQDIGDRTRMEATALELARQFLAEVQAGAARHRPLTLDSALDDDLGLDSLSRVELAARIERAFGAHLPEQVLAGAGTLRDLLAALRSATKTAPTPVTALPPANWAEPVQAEPVIAATLLDVLDWHVQAHPERVHIVHLGDGNATQISCEELQQHSKAVAAGLQEEGLVPGQTVAIMLPTSPEYFHAFFGILRAGGIPVPIYPPARLSQNEEHVRRHAGILANAQTAMLVTVPEARGVARLLEARVAGLQRVLTVPGLKTGPRGGRAHRRAAGVHRPLGHPRLPPQSAADGTPLRWPLARHRRPRLPGRWRGVPDRPRQGHHHPRRPQHLPA
jgi:acyl carrier protein